MHIISDTIQGHIPLPQPLWSFCLGPFRALHVCYAHTGLPQYVLSCFLWLPIVIPEKKARIGRAFFYALPRACENTVHRHPLTCWTTFIMHPTYLPYSSPMDLTCRCHTSLSRRKVSTESWFVRVPYIFHPSVLRNEQRPGVHLPWQA